MRHWPTNCRSCILGIMMISRILPFSFNISGMWPLTFILRCRADLQRILCLRPPLKYMAIGARSLATFFKMLEPEIVIYKVTVFIFQGVANIASVSLAIGYPNLASVPHMIINGFKNLLAIAAETDITFKEAETVSHLLNLLNLWSHFCFLNFGSFCGRIVDFALNNNAIHENGHLICKVSNIVEMQAI